MRSREGNLLDYQPRVEHFDRITIQLLSTKAGTWEADEDQLIELSIPLVKSGWLPGELRQRVENALQESDEFGYFISEKTGITNWGASASAIELVVQLSRVALDSGIGAVISKVLEKIVESKGGSAWKPGMPDEEELVRTAKHRLCVRYGLNAGDLKVIASAVESDGTRWVRLRDGVAAVYEVSCSTTPGGITVTRLFREHESAE